MDDDRFVDAAIRHLNQIDEALRSLLKATSTDFLLERISFLGLIEKGHLTPMIGAIDGAVRALRKTASDEFLVARIKFLEDIRKSRGQRG